MARIRDAVRTLLGKPPAQRRPANTPVDDGVPQPLPQLALLTARVVALEASETTRSAEHAAMVDRLDRLYKRVSRRIARSGDEEPTASQGESVLDMRSRLHR